MIPATEEIVSRKMQRDCMDSIIMYGAESSAQVILGMLKNDSEILSGILGVNDKLEIVFSDFFIDQLKTIPMDFSITKACRASATGVIVFDVHEGKVFVSDSQLIDKLNSVCESAGLTLIDLMLFGTYDWLSLRQENRI